MNNPFKIDPPSSVEIELEREPFLGSSGKDELDVVDVDGHSSGRRLLLLLAGIVLLSFSSISILHVLLRQNISVTPGKIFPTLLYSPVEHLLEYQHVRFHTGFFDDEEPSVFDGPSTDAMDKAWLDLYDIWTYAVSSLTEDENDRLPDPTVPAFGNHSQLFGGIDVFHQLHCLDYVRQAIEPDRYSRGHHHSKKRAISPPLVPRRATTDLPHVSDAEHVAHCIDMIRQSLMCSADISVVLWYFADASVMKGPRGNRKGKLFPRFDQTRLCRNFDKIKGWAGERTPNARDLEAVLPRPH